MDLNARTEGHGATQNDSDILDLLRLGYKLAEENNWGIILVVSSLDLNTVFTNVSYAYDV